MSCIILTMRFSHFLILEFLSAIITFLPKKLNCIMFVLKINDIHQNERWLVVFIVEKTLKAQLSILLKIILPRNLRECRQYTNYFAISLSPEYIKTKTMNIHYLAMTNFILGKYKWLAYSQ
ncbi:MAG TPA: hypothetical protein VI033_00110 [Candidatus Nitrosopolaris sp.]